MVSMLDNTSSKKIDKNRFVFFCHFDQKSDKIKNRFPGTGTGFCGIFFSTGDVRSNDSKAVYGA